MEKVGSDKIPHIVLISVFSILFLALFSPFNGAGSDPILYYAYLSSFLFDGDVDIMNDCYLANNSYGPILHMISTLGPKGLVNNQYAIGSAVLWLPFYLPVRAVAWVLNWMLTTPPAWTNDRYSAPYLFAVSFAAMSYGFLTLLLIYHTCRFRYGQTVSLLAALGAVFASPLVEYVFSYPAMSHAQSAFCIALLLYLGFRHRDFPGLHSYMLQAAALALAILVRWQNIVFAAVPLAFWLDYRLGQRPERALTREAPRIAAAAVVLAAIASLQSVYWWAQLGSFATVPQGESFMVWTSPRVGKVLFSGWHGLYYWHPLMLLASVGLLVYLIHHRRSFFPYAAIVCFALITYVNAAVGDWWAGDAFGARRFSGCLPLLGLGLAAFWSLFRGRLLAVPIALTAVALAANLVLLMAHTRGTFDIYFLNETWAVRWELLGVLPRWIVTLPLNSYACAQLIVARDFVPAIAAAAIGLLLIAGFTALLCKGFFLSVENKGTLLASALAAFILLLDLAIYWRCPPTDQNGILFSRAVSDPTLPMEKRKEIVSNLIQNQYRNPAVHFHAVETFQDRAALPDHLNAVRRISPQLWAKWIAALPPGLVEESTRKEAQTLLKSPIPAAFFLYGDRISRAAQTGDISSERQWLSRFLRYDPFSIPMLRRLGDIYAARGRYREARQLRSRLRHFLEAKMSNVLAIEGRVGHWRGYLFVDKYMRFARELAIFYENAGEYDRALAQWAEIERRCPNDPFVRRQRLALQLQTESPDADPAALLQELNDPNAPVDAFITATKLLIKRQNLKAALATLESGFRYHPLDQQLGHWLRQILATYPVAELPFDDLLAATVDSPEYWVAVAEYLNLAGRFEDSRRVMQKVLLQRPDQPWANFVYGFALFHLQQFAQAEAAFRVAFDASPEYSTYGTFLARALSGQGRHDEALQVIARALEKSPDDEQLKHWQKQIEATKAGNK